MNKIFGSTIERIFLLRKKPIGKSIIDIPNARGKTE